jgi:hypothetical protein
VAAIKDPRRTHSLSRPRASDIPPKLFWVLWSGFRFLTEETEGWGEADLLVIYVTPPYRIQMTRVRVCLNITTTDGITTTSVALELYSQDNSQTASAHAVAPRDSLLSVTYTYTHTHTHTHEQHRPPIVYVKYVYETPFTAQERSERRVCLNCTVDCRNVVGARA